MIGVAETTTVVLAAVAAALGAGGAIPEVVRWWQKREDKLVAQRADTMSASDRLLSRLEKQVDKFTVRLDASDQKIRALLVENYAYKAQTEDLVRKYTRLDSDHQALKQEHDALKEHLTTVENRERMLRRKLNVEDDTGQIHILESIPRPPPIPREEKKTRKPPEE